VIYNDFSGMLRVGGETFRDSGVAFQGAGRKKLWVYLEECADGVGVSGPRSAVVLSQVKNFSGEVR
jgi:hypothetical protein